MWLSFVYERPEFYMPRDPEVLIIQPPPPPPPTINISGEKPIVQDIEPRVEKKCDKCNNKLGENKKKCEYGHEICDKCVKKLVSEQEKKKFIHCPGGSNCEAKFDREKLREEFNIQKEKGMEKEIITDSYADRNKRQQETYSNKQPIIPPFNIEDKNQNKNDSKHDPPFPIENKPPPFNNVKTDYFIFIFIFFFFFLIFFCDYRIIITTINLSKIHHNK
jgi:hypothetical protein